MTDFTRRGFLKVLGIAGAVGTGTAIAGCGGGDSADMAPTDEPMEDAAPMDDAAAADDSFTCQDTSGLAEADITLRTSLQYTDTSPEEGKNCANCALYVVPESGTGCGTCQTVKGPVHPLGYCTIWAQMTG